MTADLEFRIGDEGESIDIPLTDGDGNDLDTSGYTTGVMTFYSLDRQTVIKAIAITLPANAVARWTMTNADTTITLDAGVNSLLMAGQIVMTGTGTERGTHDFSAYCYK